MMGAAHHTGVYYGGTAYVFGKEGIPFAKKATKKKAEEVNFDGLTEVYNRVAKNMWYDLIVTNKCGQPKK